MKFIHLRRHDYTPAGKITAKGGATIAYEEIEPTLIRYEVAKCCGKDVFCKKIGRDVAMGRLMSKGGQTITVPPGLSRSQIREILIEQYVKQQSRFEPTIKYIIG